MCQIHRLLLVSRPSTASDMMMSDWPATGLATSRAWVEFLENV